MYTPKAFEITDEKEIVSFIEANAFGQLISLVNGKLFATHLPFILSEDKKILIGHVAKQNPQHVDISQQEVLVTFQGAHDYISPAWYEAPGVPTWNYQAVHVYGECSLISDVEKLKKIVDTLTQKYEAKFEKPWQPNYKAELLSAIVGLEIHITDVQCKYKLSQNRSEQDKVQVIERLEKQGSLALAKEMRRNKK
jgi:transcriptional regulator